MSVNILSDGTGKSEEPSPGKENGPSDVSQRRSQISTVCGKPVLPYSPDPSLTLCIALPEHDGSCISENEARLMNHARDRVLRRRAEAEKRANRADDTTCDHGRSTALGCASCDFERMKLEVEQNAAYEGRA